MRFQHYDAQNIILHRFEGRSSDIYMTEKLDPRKVSAYVLSFDQPDNDKIKKIPPYITSQ